jgi:hypothetical protein
MKNQRKSASKKSPYATVSFEKITAPVKEGRLGGGKSTVTTGDLRVRGSK